MICRYRPPAGRPFDVPARETTSLPPDALTFDSFAPSLLPDPDVDSPSPIARAYERSLLAALGPALPARAWVYVCECGATTAIRGSGGACARCGKLMRVDVRAWDVGVGSGRT